MRADAFRMTPGHLAKQLIPEATVVLAGVDGVMFHLALFGDLSSAARFDWWSHPPPQWAPMISAAETMLAAFDLIP
jgi:hypothetical protein